MINFNKAFGIHPQAISLKQQRASLIAGNLANADTPHYKARDINFKEQLKKNLPKEYSQDNKWAVDVLFSISRNI